MRYDQAIKILFGLESFGVKLGLDNINLFVERLGHPERNFISIHVAGTNGKGTVCSTLASVLTSAGYKTGLFTSPHLVDYRERIRIDGRRIPKSDVSHFISHHHPFIRRKRITFFETTAALAFDWFARSACDFAVVEVGLGGRLDATNVLQPKLSVITAIDFDHTKTLGNTRRKIAREKAGIIKQGVPVICAPMADSARDTIEKIAARRSAMVVDSAKALSLEEIAGRYMYRISGDGGFPSPVSWRYPGAVHRDNLQTVIAVLMQLRRDGCHLPDRQITEGLRAARWPGRFQIRPGRPFYIYDVAHNAAAARGLAEALPRMAVGRHLSAVCAVAGDKEWRKMIRYLAPQVDRWYFTRFRNRRAWRLTDVRQFARKQKLHFTAGRDARKMMQLAHRETPRDGIVLVFGSHFLVGQVLPVSSIDPAPSSITSDDLQI